MRSKSRVRSSAPASLPREAPDDLRAANEIVRAIFSAMIDQGIPQGEFAERIGVAERTIEKWRSPRAFAEGAQGPGLVLVVRALHELGLSLDVLTKADRKRGRFPLSMRTDMAEMERDRLRRGETHSERALRIEKFAAEERRKGTLRDG